MFHLKKKIDMNDLMTSLVLQAFRKLVEAKNRNGEQKLLFPQKRDGSCRYSEQEFKQMFIEVFCHSEKTDGLKYSVETPTRKKYEVTVSGNACTRWSLRQTMWMCGKTW